MIIIGISMKISELILELRKIESQYGDLECAKVMHDPYDFEMYLLDPDLNVILNPCGDGKILILSED